MRIPGRVLLSITAVAYPVAVFAGLVYFRIPPRVFSLLLLVLAAGAFLTMTDSGSSGSRWKRLAQPMGLAAFALVVLASGSEGVLKLYPALVSGFLLTSFGLTLLRPPSMILRFAKLQDKTLEAKDNFPGVERYCRVVTLVWCAFFIVNICIAAYTGLYASSLAWSIYNGLISYILMGAIFFGEMVVRRFVIR